jgi:hypothetical protein
MRSGGQPSASGEEGSTERLLPSRQVPLLLEAVLQAHGFFTVKASPLDRLPSEQQHVATTILERQGKPVPVEAEADIAALAARFAQADAGMWAAAPAIAEGAEPEPKV